MNYNHRIDLVCIAGKYRNTDVLNVPPYGILYVGSALKRAGFDVILHHISSSDIEKESQKIAKEKPFMVGFSVFTGFPAKTSIYMSTLLKNIDPSIKIVWGGVHPSLISEQCLKEKSIDYVVIGEGEITAVELAICLNNNSDLSCVKGLAYKKNGAVITNAYRNFEINLDKFAIDWSLLPVERYINKSLDGKRVFTFISSRGCSGFCGFCYNYKFNKCTWRGHSIEYFISQVKEFKKKYEITHLLCNDDHFFENESRAMEIIDKLDKIGIHMYYTEMKIAKINCELLEKLKNYGVETLLIGWESGNDRILKLIKKGITVQKILEGTKILSGFPSINVIASAIIGFPTETRQEIFETVNVALKMAMIHPNICFNIGLYLPYPGTPLYELAQKEGFKIPPTTNDWGNWDMYNKNLMLTWLPWITKRDIKNFYKIALYGQILETRPKLPTDSFLKYSLKQLFRNFAKIRLKIKWFDFSFEFSILKIIKKINRYIWQFRGFKNYYE